MPNKACFIISPRDQARSAAMRRADDVLERYIRPACEGAAYEPQRAQDISGDRVKSTQNALENAPMVVAYMGPTSDAAVVSKKGASYWDANVMIEIGYRLASRLPLVFLCEADAMPELPLQVRSLTFIELPPPKPRDRSSKEDEAKDKETIESLKNKIIQEEKAGGLLSSVHAYAAINSSNRTTQDPQNLLYTAASRRANELFRWDEKNFLVGRTMEDFLDSIKRRMHKNQWKAFDRDQIVARETLVARVPIVFERHEKADCNGRAFLPIVVQEYRTEETSFLNWANLRILYLDVTTVTKKTQDEDGEEYYECQLDLSPGKKPLPPLTPHEGIRIFLSYRSDNRAIVQRLYRQLVAMTPHVSPFIDVSMREGDNWIDVLSEKIEDSELCFVFFDNKSIGKGQKAEVDYIQTRKFSGDQYPVIPVLLPYSGREPEVPNWLKTVHHVKFEELTDSKLQQLLYDRFPDRVPADWNKERLMSPPIQRKKPPQSGGDNDVIGEP